MAARAQKQSHDVSATPCLKTKGSPLAVKLLGGEVQTEFKLEQFTEDTFKAGQTFKYVSDKAIEQFVARLKMSDYIREREKELRKGMGTANKKSDVCVITVKPIMTDWKKVMKPFAATFMDFPDEVLAKASNKDQNAWTKLFVPQLVTMDWVRVRGLNPDLRCRVLCPHRRCDSGGCDVVAGRRS